MRPHWSQCECSGWVLTSLDRGADGHHPTCTARAQREALRGLAAAEQSIDLGAALAVERAETEAPAPTLDDLRAALIHALPYCYEPADQTIQCTECDACWWGVPEDIDEDWHAPGCKLFAARVMVGVSKPVRRRAQGEPSEPYAPNDPRPDTRTPSHILRDLIVSGWARQLARMSYPENAPEWLQGESWRRAVHEIITRLLKATGPLRGPYAQVEGAQPEVGSLDLDEILARAARVYPEGGWDGTEGERALETVTEDVPRLVARVRELEALYADAVRFRDAYKRAKQENDERFMIERDEARERVRELEALAQTVTDAAKAEECERIEALVRARADRYDRGARRACVAREEGWMQTATQATHLRACADEIAHGIGLPDYSSGGEVL